MRKFFFAFAVFSLLVGSAVNAKEYVFDKAHSHVGFTVKHVLSMVPGEFKEYDGSFSFDEKKPEASKVKVTIQAASINTNVDRRDAHLKSPDFFDVEKFPTLTFVSKKVSKGEGENKYKVEGDLTIHGVTKAVTLDVEYLGTDTMMGMETIGFSATTTIDRRDFGLVWGETMASAAGNLIVANKVTINLEITGMTKEAMEKMKKGASKKDEKKD